MLGSQTLEIINMRIILKNVPYICIESREGQVIWDKYFFQKGHVYWDGGSNIYEHYSQEENVLVKNFSQPNETLKHKY